MKEGVDAVDRVVALGEIARRVRTHHDEAMAAGHVFQKASEKMRAEILLCGQALLEARELVGHGDWRRWLQQYCGLSKSTAQRYMAAARPAEDVPGVGRLRAWTYGLLARWAKRMPAPEVVFAWRIEEQRKALADLEPAERLCVALRQRMSEEVTEARGGASDCLTPAESAVKPPDKESI